MKWVLPLALIAALYSGSTFAENDWNYKAGKALALIASESVGIAVYDSVKGGCMNPDGIKRAAELQLRRNNFMVSETSYATLEVNAIGGRSTTKGGRDMGCHVYIDVDLRVTMEGTPAIFYLSPEPTIFFVRYDLVGTLLSGDDMQSRLEKVVSEAIDELFLETQRAEDFLDKDYPGIRERFPPRP